MPAKTITATIPPGLARFSTAATWRSVLATAPDRSAQEILMHRASGIHHLAALPWHGGDGSPIGPPKTRSTDKGLHGGGPLSWRSGVQAGHRSEFGSAVDVGEGLGRDVDAEGRTDGLPPVAGVPLEQSLGRGRRPYVLVVAFEG